MAASMRCPGRFESVDYGMGIVGEKAFHMQEPEGLKVFDLLFSESHPILPFILVYSWGAREMVCVRTISVNAPMSV